MAVPESMQISFIGIAFLFAYISFKLEQKHTVLKVLFLGGALLAGLASAWANYSLLQNFGTNATLNSTQLNLVEKAIDSVATPYMVFMFLFLAYLGIFMMYMAFKTYPKFFGGKKK